MEMTRLQHDYPAEYAQVAYRAITSRRIQRLAFRGVVASELIATLLLWIGALALLVALVGATAADTARAVAIYGTTAFVAIWSGFLVVGNHFSYWVCHEGAQNTHFQMTLWGIGTLILLAQG